MVSITHLRVVGNNVVAFRSNGTQRIYAPTATGIFLPTDAPPVPNGSGGAEDQASPDAPSNPSGSVAAAVDDYPYPNAPKDALSPFRYSYRDCTDFVAWRINRDDGDTKAPWKWTWGNLRLTNGDAIGWRGDWIRHGWKVDIPAAAGVIGWLGTSAGAYGHVYYVQSVSSGMMVVEEYNWGGTQSYNKRTVPVPNIDSSHSFLSMPFDN